MRVLLTNTLYPTPQEPFAVGGAEIFSRKLAEQLVESGHEVEVIRTPRERPLETEVVNGVTVHTASVHNIYVPAFGNDRPAPVRAAWHFLDDRLSSTAVLRDRLENFRPDVLHSNTLGGLGSGIWSVAQAAGVPIIHTLHDYYLTCPRCHRFKAGGICRTTCTDCRVLTSGRRGRTGAVAAVVGVSRRIIDIHREQGLFLDTPLSEVVRNASRGSGTVALDPRSGPTAFGFMGRMSDEKGVRRLVEAFGQLSPGPARLILAGRTSPEEERTLRALAPAADVTFLGYVEPSDFFRQVDVVVIPSLWEEPGALVIEEALAAGRPVIVSPYGGSPEAVVSGRTGWVVEPTVPALKALLQTIARAPAEVEAMQSYLMSEARHKTMRDVEQAYVGVYERARELGSRQI
jgi:glycosyltransferase involved in cell wall biosynthesis